MTLKGLVRTAGSRLLSLTGTMLQWSGGEGTAVVGGVACHGERRASTCWLQTAVHFTRRRLRRAPPPAVHRGWFRALPCAQMEGGTAAGPWDVRNGGSPGTSCPHHPLLDREPQSQGPSCLVQGQRAAGGEAGLTTSQWPSSPAEGGPFLSPVGQDMRPPEQGLRKRRVTWLLSVTENE